MEIKKKDLGWLRPRNIVLFLIAFLMVGMAIPLLMGDGSSKFKDAEALVAAEAVHNTRNSYRGIDGLGVIGIIGYHAEKVELIETGIDPTLCRSSVSGKYEMPTSNYRITVSYRTFFGIQAQAQPVTVCYMQI